VTLKIYNMLGQEIKTLVNEQINAGVNTVTWNGQDNFGHKVSSGAYIYQIVSGNFVQTRKMILLK
ncbi:MAG: T9SS type A sorting domain-containing protein, partial [Bacteroidetes bacterium]|nr:T9SS type A sorting domain-containing protein [Bacteroidota bacterium]